MGCDIHLYVEVKKDGRWQPVDPPDDAKKVTRKDGGEYTDHGLGGLAHECRREQPHVAPEVMDWDIGRCYSTFSILANVRNGYGFAGVDTGDAFVPIAEPKDLPDDVSPEIAEISAWWGCNGHSHSWFTVSELLAYDWEQSTKHRGWVGVNGYLEWKENGKPSSWSGGICNQVEHISHQEMGKRIATRSAVPSGKAITALQSRFYCNVEWEEKYSESAAYFLHRFVPVIKELGAPDDVRIVFWFDN